MPLQIATVVILNPRTREVLLHKREDFRVWSLPGGGIEAGETWQKAAIRETFEETGHHIRIERLVGQYQRPQLPRGGSLTYVALGSVTETPAEAFGWESVAVRWFPVEELPRSLNRFGRIFLADTLAAHPDPVERTLYLPFYQAVLIRFLIGLRDLRNRLTGRR